MLTNLLLRELAALQIVTLAYLATEIALHTTAANCKATGANRIGGSDEQA